MGAAHPASRGGARHRERLPPPPPPAPPAVVRQIVPTLPRPLHAQTVQQELRPAPRSVVRAEPPRRGLRRDVRRLADPRLAVAGAARRRAGAKEAGIHGRADARAGGRDSPGDRGRTRGPAAGAPPLAARALPAQARALRPRPPGLLRSRPQTTLLRRARVRVPPAGGGLFEAHPPRGAPPGGELDRRLPVHDRPGARGDDRPLSRTQPAPGRAGGSGRARLHRAPHRADDEFSSQWSPPGGALVAMRILVLMHEDLIPPDDPGDADLAAAAWKTEYDVVTALRGMGHEG